MSGVIRLLSGNGLPGVSDFAGGASWPAHVYLSPTGPDYLGFWHWRVAGAFVRGLAPVGDRLLPLPLGNWVDGDYLPLGCLLTLGGVSVPCSYGTGSAGVGECVLRPDGELVLGVGVLRENLLWGGALELKALSVAEGEARVWLGSLLPGLDLLLMDRCSYGLLTCHKVLSDVDLPSASLVSPGEFWFSLSSGKIVFWEGASGELTVLGLGSCDQPGVLSLDIAVDGTGYGVLPLVPTGVGELFVYGKRLPVRVVDYDSELPARVSNADAVFLSRESGGFRVRPGVSQVSFRHGQLSLTVSGVGVSLLGLVFGPYDLPDTDLIYERDGVLTSVSIPGGRYTASSLAALLGVGWGVCGLGLVLTGVFSCSVLSGGGFLGFGENWVGGVRNSYYGLHLGLYRVCGDPDLSVRIFRDFDDLVLTSKINASPYVYLGAGFPYGPAEFKIYGTNGRVATCDGLGAYGSWGVGVRLDCLSGDRLFWFQHFDTGSTPVGAGFSSVSFNGQGVLPDTVTLTVQEPGGPWLPHDYELLGSGGAVLVSRIAPVNLAGAVGATGANPGDFGDPLVSDFSVCEPGGLLLTSDGEGYVITSVDVGGLTLSPATEFGPVGWEARGFGGLLADSQFVSVSTYSSVPFEVRVLTPGGGSQTLVEGMTIRYGAFDAGDSALTMLVRGVDCGVISSAFVLPSFALSDPHYLLSPVGGPWCGFSLRVPNAVTHLVSTFTVPEPLPGVIEVEANTGEVRVASDLLVSYAGLTVLYDQEFLPSSLLVTAEGNLATGEVRVPDAYAGDSYFLVEKVSAPIATLNPVAGTVYFTRPVRATQLVEARYYPTNAGGVDKTDDLVIEFLPVVVRLESAVRLSPRSYSFNSAGGVYDPNTSPLIWVDADLQNYSGVVTTTVDSSTNEIHFDYDVPASASVQITYAVLDCPANSALQSYAVSRAPVWQPPFWLVANQSSFELEGDRTNEVSVGRLISVGGFVSFVQTVVYADGVTTVNISPAPTTEVGSRSPGRDPGLLVSDGPVTEYTLVSGVGAFGTGASSIALPGAVTAQSNQILLLGDRPYMVRGANLSQDGRYTDVLLASPLQADFGGGDVYLSVRPVYPPNPVQFALAGAPLGGVTVVRFPEGEPGVIAVRDTDYTVDANGLITLRSALLPRERLYVAYTRIRSLYPTVVDGAVVTPSYRVVYDAVVQPSAENYLLDGSLTGTYQIYDPEVFELLSQSMADFLPVVQLDAANFAGNPDASATPLAFPQGTTTRFALQTENPRNAAWNALNLDAGGRVFVGLFDQAVVPFEQVLETIDGRLIGDRDGKFRFYVGSESLTPDPGGVYTLTSHLRPRILWQDIMAAWSPGTSGWEFDVDDVIYDPRTISESGVNPGQPVGTPPTSDILADFMARQRDFIRNDIDDVIMTRFRRVARESVPATLFPVIDFKGVFQGAWEPSVFSRLYPEQSRYFTRLLPGLEASVSPDTGEVLSPGFYTAGRVTVVPGGVPGTVKNQVARTRNTVIGEIANPVLGGLTRLSDVTANDRGFRFRVWRYYPNGLTPAEDLALGVATSGYATLVLTPQQINDFVLSPVTGLPDTGLLVSNGGANPDVNSGDANLSTPGIAVGKQVLLGNPDGTLRSVFYDTGLSQEAVLVESVQAGCFVLLARQTDPTNPVSGAGLVMSDPVTGGLVAFEAETGDTVYEPNSQVAIDPSTVDPANAVSLEQAALLTAAEGDYRIQTDLKVRRKTGQIIDASLPVAEDIWGLPIQEWLGQNPPLPGTCIEGDVNFDNTALEPARLPALFGEPFDDSGDQRIPFLSAGDTEIRLLQQAARLFDGLFSDTFSGTGSAYPDEIALTDGEVFDTVTGGDNPAVLHTGQDLTPAWTPGSGVGPLRAYDLLLVQTGQAALGTGAQGILTVGDVTSNTVESPRFVTQTQRGGLHAYTARNLFGHKGSGVTGVQITEVVAGPSVLVTFDFGSIFDFYLDDGSGTGSGGIDRLINTFSGNAFTVNVYDPSPLAANAYLGSFTVVGTAFPGTVYIYPPGGPVQVVANAVPTWALTSSTMLTVGLSGTSLLTALGLVSGQTYDFTLTVDTYIDATTAAITGAAVGSGVGSTTASVLPNRLDFTERVSFQSGLPRNTYPANGDSGIDMGLQLDLHLSPVGSGAVSASVNGPFAVNGGAPLTFERRLYNGGLVHAVGVFDPATGPGAGDELGTVRAMSWEGHGNQSFTASGVIVSAVASIDEDTTNGVILSGTGDMYDRLPPYANENQTWVGNIVASAGALNRVQSGDILVVTDGDTSGTGAVKSGTYLVRHVVEPNSGNFRIISPRVKAGSKACLDLTFPRITAFDWSNLTLAVSNVPSVPYAATGCPFPASGNLYVLRSNTWATWNAGVYTVDPEAVYVLAYSALTYTAGVVTFTLTGAAVDATGGALASAAIETGVSPGMRVSGMTYIPVGALEPGLPENNLLGLGGLGVAGVVQLTTGNRSIPSAPAASYTWTIGTGLVADTTGAGPGVGQLAVRVPAPEDSTAFYSDKGTVVYGRIDLGFGEVSGVATHLDLTQVGWDSTHFSGAVPANALQCLLPGDEFAFADDLLLTTPGFVAYGGLFLEPSFPMPVTDIGTGSPGPHVVSASHSTTAVGVRQYGDFVTGGTQETVTFSVRRTRRFHEAQDVLARVIDPLVYVYQTRHGNISAPIVTPTTVVTFPGGLNGMGDFTTPQAGLTRPGSVLRILDAQGTVLDTAEIRAVTGPYSLLLANQGLTQDLTAGVTFEVYLSGPPVPHEQSCAQLLDALTNPLGGGAILYERRVDYSTYPFGDGGYCATANILTDPGLALLTTPIPEGAYVVVDPAGGLYAPGESGQGPRGDTSVQGRVPYVAGRPNPLDDNRGFYRVTANQTPGGDSLEVSGESQFSGAAPTGGDDVIRGATGAEYAVLPTVHDSLIPEGATEGQQALRVTASADGSGSFAARTGNDAYRSIQPFGFKVIQPASNVFTTRETVETVLFMRERMLTWIATMSGVYGRGGDYYVFQERDQIDNLPSPTDDSLGAGVFTNLVVTGLQGLVDTAPFANDADCLSVLDRRLWINDTGLDYESPTGAAPFYAELSTDGLGQHPVLTDAIADALDNVEDLHGARYAWVAYRTNQSDGTIVRAKRAELRVAEMESAQRNAKRRGR